MIDQIRPRGWAIAAVAAFGLGIIGLYIGWSRWAPIAILAGEICTILAMIALTTPSTAASLAARRADPQASPAPHDTPSQDHTSPPDAEE